MVDEVKRGQDEARVQREVRQAFKMLADAYGISVNEQDMPSVKVSASETPFYNPTDKSITINPENVGDGVSYFEEASHALRDLSWNRRSAFRKMIDVSSKKPSSYIQEFYGRTGETLGRELTRGTELAYLFEGVPPRNLDDPETRNRWAQRIKKYRTLNSKVKNISKKNESARSFFRDLTSRNYDALIGSLTDAKEGKIGVFNLARRLDELEQEYRGGIRKANQDYRGSVTETELIGIKAYLEKLLYTKRGFKIASEAPQDERTEILSHVLKSLIETRDSSVFNFDVENSQLVSAGLNSFLGIFSHRVHSKPYQYAQQYGAQDLLGVENFYGLSDREAEKRFFKRLKPRIPAKTILTRSITPQLSGLEQTVVAAFFIVMPLFLIILVDNLKSTGFAVALSPASNFTLGLGLWIVLVILVGAWGYLVLRKYLRKMRFRRI